MITLSMRGPSAAVTPSASSIAGNDISASITRITNGSRRRNCAARMPKAAPNRPENDGDHEADPERNARAVEHAGVDVAAEIVGAEREGCGRRLEAEAHLHARRIEAGEQRREDRRQREQRDEHEADLERSVTRQTAQQHEPAPRRERARDRAGGEISHSAPAGSAKV